MAPFRILADHPALDLANTVAPRRPGGEDCLSSPEGLLSWAGRAGVVREAEAERIGLAWKLSPGAAQETFADVRAVRAMIDPGLAGHGLAELTRRWAAAIGRSTLVPGAARAVLEVGADPALLIPDRLADAVVDLLRHADRSRLRACPIADGGCGWLFLDRSRNGSRRWCAMDDCGAHAKSRRLTERRRAQR
jgi:predicted RNA-binding Zn ribbon-like protein